MPTYTFQRAPVLIETTGEFAIGAQGVLRSTEGGDPLPIYDLNGSAITSILVGPEGAHVAFKADVPDGVLDFGSVQLPTESLEQRRASLEAVQTASSAQFAADEALATAQAVSASSVQFWSAGEFVAAGTIRMSPTGLTIRRNADGTTGGTYDTTEANAWTVVTAATAAYTDKVITANYTVVAADAALRTLVFGGTVNFTVTLPANVVGTGIRIPWRVDGTAQITFAPGTGVTVNSRGNAKKTAGQYAEGLITPVSGTEWRVAGDVTV